MRQRSVAVLWLVCGMVAWLGGGCGSRRPAVDSAPFAAAVNAYLQAQSMDVKVEAFRRLDVAGDQATATVSLGHAEGGAGVKVQWEFTFARTADRWQVSSCRR